jgi:hypothetical protein
MIIVITNSSLKDLKSNGARLVSGFHNASNERILFINRNRFGFERNEFNTFYFLPVPLMQFLSRSLQFLRYKAFKNLPARTLTHTYFSLITKIYVKLILYFYSGILTIYTLEPIIIKRHKKIKKFIFELNVAPPSRVIEVAQIFGSNPELLFLKQQVHAIRFCDILVVGSDYNVQYIDKSCRFKTRVLPRANNKDLGRDISSSVRIVADFMYVGNFTLSKGAALLIEIMSDPRMSKYTLSVIGRIPSGVRLLLPANIIELGFGNVRYDEGTVFVFPSYCEGSSRAVAEALYHRKLCLVSEAASGQITSGSFGLVVKDFNKETWISNMLYGLDLYKSGRVDDQLKKNTSIMLDLEKKYWSEIMGLLE